MTLPTFVVGGAPKAGTTAIWRFLSAHPQVWMSEIKEPHFLTRDATNPAPGVRIVGTARPNTYARGMAWYESLFEGAEGFPARGEASTHYLCALDGPELMERHVPGLKVIFVLRNPVDRAYSHYWHYWKRGWDLPPFEALLDDHPALRYLSYVSAYRQHLERYLTALGPDRVRIHLYDDLRDRPAEVFADICRFIGVDDTFRPEFEKQYNVHAIPRNRPLQRVISWTKYQRWTFIPRPIRRRMHRLREMVEARNLRRAQYTPISPELYARVYDLFADDVEYVETLTRPLPAWRPGVVAAPAQSR